MEDFLRDLNVFNVLSSYRSARAPKSYKSRFNPFELGEKQFRQKYRFSKLNMKKLINLVRSELEGSNRGGHIPADLQVMAAIRYWGRNEVCVCSFYDRSGSI